MISCLNVYQDTKKKLKIKIESLEKYKNMNEKNEQKYQSRTANVLYTNGHDSIR